MVAIAAPTHCVSLLQQIQQNVKQNKQNDTEDDEETSGRQRASKRRKTQNYIISMRRR